MYGGGGEDSTINSASTKVPNPGSKVFFTTWNTHAKKRAVDQNFCKTTTPEVRFSCVKANAICFFNFPLRENEIFQTFFFLLFLQGGIVMV